MTLNDLECLKLHQLLISDTFLADVVNTTIDCSRVCDCAVFCALHDQLASLDRHVQLTRCFSAAAELLAVFLSEPLKVSL